MRGLIIFFMDCYTLNYKDLVIGREKVKKIVLIIAIAAFIVGCQMTKSTNLTTADLYGKYHLVSFDQEAITDVSTSMGIEFEQGGSDVLKVHGILCNTFIGQATLNNGQLKSDGLASTRMACFRQKEATMENALNVMFKEGAIVKLKGDELTLEDNNHSFVYKKQ
ncbi:META domain-containing protein [Entomomonas moraniae]|uniref:META domain-containing protein n=1 Tax=Entomomonas moraniae TaxID=2213226 RepID=A0A3Q9JM14_9GAMM|nr:META domain-containing protein [Entomomonas moraniae]